MSEDSILDSAKKREESDNNKDSTEKNSDKSRPKNLIGINLELFNEQRAKKVKKRKDK